MTLNEFQKSALESAMYPKNYRIIYPTIGLAGEAGEVADKVKKLHSRMERGKINGSGDSR